MRTHRQLVLYQSILQVLQESGCPFCRFLKEYQTARLQNHPKERYSPSVQLSRMGSGRSSGRAGCSAGIHQAGG